ncbi:hypothetical protein [Pseudomonas sp. SCT]|uniref:hypothetical protein n=1 Tax=Pseudomonas sp. (strain SCT) TaxID=412955 RepID=UPI002113DD6A|nr:hypothetical protein [Pseudomonas sp. SCT]
MLQLQRPPFVATPLGARQLHLQIDYGQSLRQPGNPLFVSFEVWRRGFVRGFWQRKQCDSGALNGQGLWRQRAEKTGYLQVNCVYLRSYVQTVGCLLNIVQPVDKHALARKAQALPLESLDTLRTLKQVPLIPGETASEQCRYQ